MRHVYELILSYLISSPDHILTCTTFSLNINETGLECSLKEISFIKQFNPSADHILTRTTFSLNINEFGLNCSL